MTETADLGQVLAQGTQQLASVGISSARVDAELLAAHLLDISRGELAAGLIMGRKFPLDLAKYHDLIAERAQRIPLQHLTGRAPFRGLELAVGPGVFIPRPETETVAQVAIDAIIAAAQDTAGPVIAVDLCTGSGAIALALVTETAAEVHGVEYSDLAFAWAQRNHELTAARCGSETAARLHLHQGDATDPLLLAELDGRVAVVVTNPPYIPPDQVPVDIEVAEHDPEIALYGRGADGLEVPRAVLKRAHRLLRPGGVLIMEHAEVQAAALRAAATAQGFSQVETRADLTGRPRMLYARVQLTTAQMGEWEP